MGAGVKKSEMAKKLSKYINDNTDIIGGHLLLSATDIIDFLQKEGMLAPTRTYEDWAGMGTITETDNTWAPEDRRTT